MSYKKICADLLSAATDLPEHQSVFNSAIEVIESQGKSINFYEECIDTAIKDREYFETDRNKLAAINAELLEALKVIAYWHDQDIAIDESLWDAARDAIARAAGEQQRLI